MAFELTFSPLLLATRFSKPCLKIKHQWGQKSWFVWVFFFLPYISFQVSLAGCAGGVYRGTLFVYWHAIYTVLNQPKAISMLWCWATIQASNQPLADKPCLLQDALMLLQVHLGLRCSSQTFRLLLLSGYKLWVLSLLNRNLLVPHTRNFAASWCVY